MSLEEDRLEKIKHIILEHKGKLNAINAREIALLVEIPDNDTFSVTRGLITKLIRDEGLPIGAYGNGYFIIESQSELDDYVKDLNQRIFSTTTRIAQVVSNFQKHYGKDVKILSYSDEGYENV